MVGMKEYFRDTSVFEYNVNTERDLDALNKIKKNILSRTRGTVRITIETIGDEVK